MKYLVILALLLTASCATTRFYKVRDEFKPYIERFKTEAKPYEIKIEDLYIKFHDFKGAPAIGDCRHAVWNWHFVPLIRIDRDWWGRSSELAKELLIFHELGHCILSKKHNNNRVKDEIYPEFERPESIMNEYVIAEEWYQAYKEKYIKELFENE